MEEAREVLGLGDDVLAVQNGQKSKLNNLVDMTVDTVTLTLTLTTLTLTPNLLVTLNRP
jgi:hypothetical protein